MKYRKKTEIIEAYQWNGDEEDENIYSFKYWGKLYSPAETDLLKGYRLYRGEGYLGEFIEIGYWIIKSDYGISCMDPKTFARCYEIA